MPVDSFKYLPRLIARYYKLSRVELELPIPWTPLTRSLAQCRPSRPRWGGISVTSCALCGGVVGHQTPSHDWDVPAHRRPLRR